MIMNKHATSTGGQNTKNFMRMNNGEGESEEQLNDNKIPINYKWKIKPPAHHFIKIEDPNQLDMDNQRKALTKEDY